MSTLLQENDYFKSSDMALCSALCCFGYQIETIDRQNQSKAVFLIKKDEKIDAVIQAFFTHQLTVEPLVYFNFLKEIKTRIYNV